MELTLLFFASFGSVIVLFLFYSGYFTPVKFTTVELPTLTLAVLPFVGAYKTSSSLQVELFEELKDAGLDVDSSAGIYFDNPKKVVESEHRSLVGVVIKPENRERFLALDSKARLVELQSQKVLHTSFAYKSGLSILLAIMKVYPAILKRVKRQAFELYENIEVYDFPHKRLHFYFPKQSVESLWDLHK